MCHAALPRSDPYRQSLRKPGRSHSVTGVSLIQRLAVVVGSLLLVGAAAATFLPTSPQGATCGTWVAPEWNEDHVDKLREQANSLAEQDFTGEFGGEALAIAAGSQKALRICDDALGTRRTVTFVLVGLAVLVPVGLLFVGGGRRTESEDRRRAVTDRSR